MTATAPAKAPPKETWRDWQPVDAPDPYEYTQPVLLERLRDRAGVNVSANNLRYWQTVGAIPYPVRRQHDGAVRAFYPDWLLNLIPQLMRLQQNGDSWESIAAKMRELARQYAFPQVTLTVVGRNVESEQAATAKLDAAIRAFIEWHEQVTGTSITHADIRFFDADNRQRARHTYES